MAYMRGKGLQDFRRNAWRAGVLSKFTRTAAARSIEADCWRLPGLPGLSGSPCPIRPFPLLPRDRGTSTSSATFRRITEDHREARAGSATLDHTPNLAAWRPDQNQRVYDSPSSYLSRPASSTRP
ncbi:hypothetical protein Hte_005857 [Hypoxylon texense]